MPAGWLYCCCIYLPLVSVSLPAYCCNCSWQAAGHHPTHHPTHVGTPKERHQGRGSGLDDEDLELEEDGPDQLVLPAPLPGMTLADASTPASSLPSFNEEQHMQPMMMKLLRAVAAAVGSDAHISDTHATKMHDPACAPDCVNLAESGSVLAWSQIVWVCELKLGTRKTEVDVMRGQLVQRSMAALEAQPQRRSIVGVGFSMNSIEVSMGVSGVIG